MLSEPLKLIFSLLLLVLPLAAQTKSADVKPADFVFTHGKVYTVNVIKLRQPFINPKVA